MSREAALLAVVAAGGLVGLQAPVNAELARIVGTYGAASVNFLVGSACVLGVTLLLAGGFGGDDAASGVPWYYWLLGGVAGATYVTVALATVKTLGVGGVTAATIAGQLTLAVIVDRLGALGLEERAITWQRLLGVALLAAGTLLVVRD